MSTMPSVRFWSEPPGQETGSADPSVLAIGASLYLAYNARNPAFPGWESGAAPEHPGFVAHVALVRFDLVRIHRLGYPNSEALRGHPLHKCGLRCYAFQTIDDSPWIAELCHRNEVHPRHDASVWKGLKHWIVTFEDATLEVVAKAARVVGVYESTTPECVLQTVNASKGEPHAAPNGGPAKHAGNSDAVDGPPSVT
jgi:hypothetical protein